MTTKYRLLISFLTVPAAMLGLLAINDWLMSRVQIGGPLYEEINQGQELVADLLPPPLFIVEAHELAHELLDAESEKDARQIKAVRARLLDLQTEYRMRQLHWQHVLAKGALGEVLGGSVHAPASRYFQILNERFLPAIEMGDAREARNALRGPMQSAYALHRMGVLAAVGAAREQAAFREHEVSSYRSTVFLNMVLASVALLGACSFFLYRSWLPTGRQP